MMSATLGLLSRRGPFFVRTQTQLPDNAIKSDVQKCRFALFLYTGYGKRYVRISYSEDGQEFAQELSARLRQAGITHSQELRPNCRFCQA